MSMLASTTSLDIPIGRKSSNSSSSPNNNNNNNERLTLMGRSRAGDGTAFCIPQLKLLLDCGVPIQQWTPRQVFLSHTHSDHVHYLTRVNNNNNSNSQQGGGKCKQHPPPPPPIPLVFLPAKAVSFVERYLRAHQEMIDCKTVMESQDQESQNNDVNNGDDYDRGMLELRPTLPGEEIVLNGVGGGGRTYFVRTVECHHRIDTLGFSVFRKAKQQPRVLKDEYIGLSGKEIGRLVKEGKVDVFMPAAAAAATTSTEQLQDTDEAVFCFLGDTTHHVFEMHPEILSQHSIIIVECSFIDEKDLSRAAQTKHMHWNHLRPFVEAHPDILFVLIHFSLKYSSLELRRFFCNVSSRHQNIHPMLIQQDVESDWNKSQSSSSKGEDKRGRRQEGEEEGETAPPVCNCRICTSSDSSTSGRT
jgi:ribonuclease Z